MSTSVPHAAHTDITVTHANGRRRPGMSLADVPGRPWIMLRGDAEEGAYSTLPGDVEVRYSTVPTAITQDADGVDVTLHDTAAGTTATERFESRWGAG
ncbi:hypothetical protein FPZ12_034590 [Amycolatopsis acidicola]|uniref:Uncharacterized protein n=1 Tax=Amycolatopsis acidicola TaxID=2596893 RepID=A0A5N0UQG3_9PSEU|nr:hypothetical protein [Amycolatopsis acidicola]KAA9153471.1 hypothetical protein FPZ12_034590 [Amycolatopsis acidicola]